MSEKREYFPVFMAPSTSPDGASDASENLLEKALLGEDFAASSSGSDIPVEQPETMTMESLQMSSPAGKAEPPAAITYNGCYRQSGSFTIGQTGRLIIRWRQAPPIKNVKYPWRSQAIAFEIYKDGKRLTGWRLAGPAYLNNQGHIHLPVVSPKGVAHVFRSRLSFYSEDFKALVKMLTQFRAEYRHISKHGWKSASFVFSNKKRKIVATKSTLLLGALIKKIGAKAIANSKKESKPFADRIHDNILRMLNNKTMGGLALRMAEAAGLQIAHHPTRGRSLLVPGQSAAAGATPGATQHQTNGEIVMGAPLAPEFIDGLNRLAERVRSPRNPTEAEVGEALRLYNQQFEDEQREAFLDSMADYLANQRRIYRRGASPNQFAGLRRFLGNFLGDVREFREGRLNRRQFDSILTVVEVELGLTGPTMRSADLLNLIQQMPGFEITANARRDNARELLVDAVERNQALLQMRRELAQIHPDLWHQILYMAGYLLITVPVPKP